MLSGGICYTLVAPKKSRRVDGFQIEVPYTKIKGLLHLLYSTVIKIPYFKVTFFFVLDKCLVGYI